MPQLASRCLPRRPRSIALLRPGAAGLLGLCGALLSAPAGAADFWDLDWLVGTAGDPATVTLGVGGILRPDYEGAKHMGVDPVPVIEIDKLFHGRLFLSTVDGVGVNLLSGGPLKLKAAVNYSGGRDSGDNDRLRGLDDIDAAAVVSARLTYDLAPFTTTLDITHRFGSDSGSQFVLGAAYGFSPIRDLKLSLGGRVSFADGSYQNAFFGVSEREAARATALGNPMTAYKAEGGFHDVGLKLSGTYSLSDSWLLSGAVGATLLVGDAADSPLTERELQPTAYLGLAYRF